MCQFFITYLLDDFSAFFAPVDVRWVAGQGEGLNYICRTSKTFVDLEINALVNLNSLYQLSSDCYSDI